MYRRGIDALWGLYRHIGGHVRAVASGASRLEVLDISMWAALTDGHIDGLGCAFVQIFGVGGVWRNPGWRIADLYT